MKIGREKTIWSAIVVSVVMAIGFITVAITRPDAGDKDGPVLELRVWDLDYYYEQIVKTLETAKQSGVKDEVESEEISP